MNSTIVILTLVFFTGFIISFIFLVRELREKEKSVSNNEHPIIKQHIPFNDVIVLLRDNLHTIASVKQSGYCVQDLSGNQKLIESQHDHFTTIHERYKIKETCEWI